MNTRLHCRKLPPIGIGGWGTAERITENWRVGSAGPPQNAASRSRAGSYSILLADTSAERSISNSRRGGQRRDRRNSRIDILGDGRPVGIHNVAAGTKTLTAGAPAPHCHSSRRLVSLRRRQRFACRLRSDLAAYLRVSGAARPPPAAPAHPRAPEIRRRPSPPLTLRTTAQQRRSRGSHPRNRWRSRHSAPRASPKALSPTHRNRSSHLTRPSSGYGAGRGRRAERRS